MKDAIKSRLADMRAMFLGTAEARLSEAEELLGASGAPDAQTSRALHHILHQLRGNAGMLGCRELGTALHPLLMLSEDVDAEARGFSADESGIIRVGLIAARDALERDVMAQPILPPQPTTASDI